MTAMRIAKIQAEDVPYLWLSEDELLLFPEDVPWTPVDALHEKSVPSTSLIGADVTMAHFIDIVTPAQLVCAHIIFAEAHAGDWLKSVERQQRLFLLRGPDPRSFDSLVEALPFQEVVLVGCVIRGDSIGLTAVPRSPDQ